MRVVGLVAYHVFKESVRDKVLYNLVLFAVLMISAHWEEREFTLTSGVKPPMIYDYGGFPDYTYQIRYDAPGDPSLAERTRQMIMEAGLPSRLDPERGFDHGAFTPLKVMYPDANVPVVQLSLQRGLDPGRHLALGRHRAGGRCGRRTPA